MGQCSVNTEGRLSPSDVSHAGHMCPEVHTQLHASCSGTRVSSRPRRVWVFFLFQAMPPRWSPARFSYMN